MSASSLVRRSSRPPKTPTTLPSAAEAQAGNPQPAARPHEEAWLQHPGPRRQATLQATLQPTREQERPETMGRPKQRQATAEPNDGHFDARPDACTTDAFRYQV
jgi:hypothetical protein